MLKIYKASAGSGKTYQLARQYIEYLLTAREGEQKPRLRSAEELQDAASHILAITFTNKATSEMKERIIARLADLANPGLDPAETPYLDDFIKLTGADVELIRERAAEALGILLNNFSDFRISTIDSFFQTVLRTFAYETGIDDAYELELDSDYLARAATDATLTEMDHPQRDDRSGRWLRQLMSWSANEGNKWNIFEKRESKKSLYALLLMRVRRMQDERFTPMRESLIEWFGKHPDFPDRLARYDGALNDRKRDAHRKAVEAAKELFAELEQFGQSDLNASIRSHCINVIGSKADKPFDKTIYEQVEPSKIFRAAFYKKNADICQRGLEKGQAFYDALKPWKSYVKDEAAKLWDEYVANMRFLQLAVAVCAKSAEMLREEKTVALGQTNTMLSKIIARDDTPFIYERLGAKLDHYLIDEFQDTSLMQWANLRPLLEESLGRGNGNLVIGDAKQSIYRFRGAEPSVITDHVPDDLGPWLEPGSNDETQNTNYRSSLQVIRFNNFLFDRLAAKLDSFEDSDDEFFSRLFANVIQDIKQTAPRGYIEVRAGEKADSDSDVLPFQYDDIPAIIESILERGYRKRDIAILVRAKDDGDRAVRSLLKHNASLDDPSRRISFISEESLLVGSAVSVEVLLSVLELIARGVQPDDEKFFNCRLRLFSLAHRDEFSQEQMLQAFLNDPQARSLEMPELIPMRSMPLPWLVERLVELYLSDEDRRRDASFIAAFQDIVIEYCEHRPADVASFLQWWTEKGSTRSITASDDADDVRIMTIHKSKGLEFPCVIIPWVNENTDFGSLNRDSSEWMWVRPHGELLDPPVDNASLPPVVPLLLTPNLDKIPCHRNQYLQELRKRRMDWLNTLYVACTRAVDELYMFVGETKHIGKLIPEFLKSDCSPLMPDPSDVMTDVSEKILLQMGKKGHPLPKDDKTGAEAVCLDNYFVRSPADFLHFRTVSTEDPEQRDIRAQGTLMHAIMAEVHTPDDVDRAVRRRVVSGEIADEEGIRISAMLREKIADPQVTGWFAPGLRVVTERGLLRRGYGDRRPDRIVIDENGATAVIDYKFGNVRDDARYLRQIRAYAKALRDASPAGSAGIVAGYLWYVNLGLVIKA